MKKQKSKKKIQNKLLQNNGITLVALIVTIVVLLILAGITITYMIGDNSLLKRTTNAKIQTEIADYKERLELAKGPVMIEGLGTFNPDRYFEVIENEGIIEDKETDVVDNGTGIYDVTTKPGYIFEVELMPNKENPTDAKIEYIGQAGKIAPIIKRIETSSTPTSITAKAIVTRLGNGTVTYYYKLKTEADSEYKEVTDVNTETGATITEGITLGETYTVKVAAKNDVGETVKTIEITAKEVATSIEINSVRLRIAIGYTRWLTATVEPNTVSQELEWSSSNTNVATVDNTGKITAKAVGTTTITVKTKDGSNLSKICKVTVADGVDITTLTSIQAKNTIAKDSYGNLITVPGGFKILTSEGTNVTQGIVIQDEEGNEFVWVPVDSVSKGASERADDIRLGRYTFDESNGTPTLHQDADNYTEIISIGMFQELTSSSTNTPAKNLGDFVTKTQANGGYYLGRYEASQGIDGKVDSQTDKIVWNKITQPNAATAARGMYNSSYVESDLINSYSWDTAIVFVQKYSENSNYANKTSINDSNIGKLNTGKAGDKVCNIHDMASNFYEWCTEHSKNVNYPCMNRGGFFGWNHAKSSNRGNYVAYAANLISQISFRPLLYVK